MADDVPILYVAGTGRSGSTVLANVLGEVDGFVSVGELRYLWERGLVEDRLCGCGQPFSGCAFWSKVLWVAFGEHPPEVGRMLSYQGENGRLRNLPRLVFRRRHSERSMAARPEALAPGERSIPDGLAKLYAAVLEVSGARVVVDSSKLPSYAAVLDTIPQLRITLLHLVRDPRAAAFSWRRRKLQPDRRAHAYMERRGVLKSVALWMAWNAGAELLWRRHRNRYVRVKYEDFVADPRALVARVLAACGCHDEMTGLFTGTSTVNLGVSHTVAGNPARLRHGAVTLELDDEWVRAMPWRDRLLVSVLAAPLLLRYGYPFRTIPRRTGPR